MSKNKDLDAYHAAQSDIQKEKGKGVNLKTAKEKYLDDYYDDRNSTKDDVFYEDGDGELEIEWKKTTRKLDNK